MSIEEIAMDAKRAEGTLMIDVLSDVVCPWCFVGKRRLEIALSTLAAASPKLGPVVSWHPFELNPDLPREGIDRRDYVSAKFGGSARVADAHSRLVAVGAPLNIDFRFDAIARQPNTHDAHRLVSWAQQRADASPLVERLFTAFFIDGRDVGDRDELARIAAESGFDSADAARMLDSDALSDRVAATQQRARELGVSGVPFFIFNDRVAVSGAQEPATLVAAIEQSFAHEPT
jgi:predicted DsbA family dithiol-disulfide isomerase